MPAVARLLTIDAVGTFSGAGAGNRHPTPGPGQATALARVKTGNRATKVPGLSKGPDLASLKRRSHQGLPPTQGVPSTQADQEAVPPALTARRGSRASPMAARVTAGRTVACPRGDTAARGTVPRSPVTTSRVTLRTRHRHRTRSPAARHQDSSLAGTRSSSRRRRAAPATPATRATSDRATGPAPTATASRGRALAPRSVRATHRDPASPGRVPRQGDRPGTRRPASSPVRWARGQARTIQAPRSQARSPEVSRRLSRGRCRPATPPGACRTRARRPAVSSLRPVSSRLARRPPASSLPAGPVPECPVRRGRAAARSRQGRPASKVSGGTGRRRATASGEPAAAACPSGRRRPGPGADADHDLRAGQPDQPA